MEEKKLFTRSFEVRWADLDANRHLRHTAYLDYATRATRISSESGLL